VKRLYKVTAEVEFMVVSDSERNAEKISEKEFREVVEDEFDQFSFSAREVKSYKEIDNTWIDGFPYGQACRETCEEILLAIEEEEAANARKVAIDKDQLKFDF
jgi:hypothetical protein